MAVSQKGKKKTGSGTGSRKTNASKKTNSRPVRSVKKKKHVGISPELRSNILLILLLAVAVILFISNIGYGGALGQTLSTFFFGAFGFLNYAFPFLFLGFVLYLRWCIRKSRVNPGRIIGLVGLYVFLCAFLQLLMNGYVKNTRIQDYFTDASLDHLGGGLLGGMIVQLFGGLLGIVGAYIIVIAAILVFAVLATQKPLVSRVRENGARAVRSVRLHQEEVAEAGAQEEEEAPAPVQQKKKKETRRKSRAEKAREQKEAERKLRRAQDRLQAKQLYEEDASEEGGDVLELLEQMEQEEKENAGLRERYSYTTSLKEMRQDGLQDREAASPVHMMEEISAVPDETVEEKPRRRSSKRKKSAPEATEKEAVILPESQTGDDTYRIPPLSLLQPGKSGGGPNDKSLRETAARLEQTLRNFGVDVTMLGYSCGPTVTRYELQPAQGVKVSRIVNLADDIKLNLAAADIRIEAPIPGKAAIGIEVPNKNNAMVTLRELLESDAFRESKSKIAFGLGKDLSGQPVIADIARMPHLLIAGATGSGKSVCINTIVLSILYHASPKEVGLIMIDPKVVELSVYNGIPHLLSPVVTDPKKASAALNWAVQEMTKRYNAFAQYGVRDIKGYNSRVKALHDIPEDQKPELMRQIVVIVDELADLMMVAPGEVEDAICRLAQLARAAGIHLVIATQRPSVNVITGLIKANMPSRIALTVSSGVDSRTIIDSNGAEKLLGHGDMLYYPQGYSKPARVQGAFVSDEEIADIVNYICEHSESTETNQELEEHLSNPSVAASAVEASDSGRDEYFAEAARLIIEKDKASIGMLQRAYRIGFNRAARIMDQLAEFGVVGGEEGTKPRKILMTSEEFEQRLEG